MNISTLADITSYDLIPTNDNIEDWNLDHNTGEMVIDRIDGATFRFQIEWDEDETAEGWSWAEYDAEGNCEGQGGDAFDTTADAAIAEITRWANEA